MKRTGLASLVTWTLLAIALEPFPVTSIVTSYEKLRKLVDGGDGALIQGIEDTIAEGQERIKNLTKILAQHYQTPKKDFEFQADHPNAFYHLVKHYVSSWYDSDVQDDLFPVLEDVIQNQNISFPVVNDFPDAVLALVRLQTMYKLKAQDMFDGNYLGYMGPALDTEDAYLVGKQAFMAGHLHEAKAWLEMSVDLLAQAIDNPKEDEETPIDTLREDYVWALALLGRAYFYINDTESAQNIYEQCTSFGLEDIEDEAELLKELEAENKTKLLEEYAPIEMDENVTTLCSREKDHRIPVMRPYHVCRYKSDPFIPYRRFKEEILSKSPYASVFYNVIHDAEMEKLKEIVKETGLTRGRVVGDGKGTVSDTRTGDLGWVADDQDPLVAQVSARVATFTGLDVTLRGHHTRQSSEAMQVVNYGLGGHYDVHMDPFGDRGIQNRLATVLFYLSDVEKGGATIFPRVGISVSPEKGMALLWYSFQPHMKDRDEQTHHAGCPVLMGNKWIANKWVWTYGNTFRRPCGLTPEAHQLEVEKIPSLNTLREVIA